MSEVWRLSADISVLQQRAKILHLIRQFFARENVLELEVPVLAKYSVSDPWLDALDVSVNGEQQWLQTSPEYYLKRALASGSGSVYSLGKAFRADERGRLHEAEFTMLEWYRLDYDDTALIGEITELLLLLKPDLSVTRSSYAELFEKLFSIDVHSADAKQLEALAKEQLDVNWQDDKSGWLDLIFSHLVEPQLGQGLHIVYDYPECQAALARLGFNKAGQKVAKRFECFIDGVELANGYWELCDADEQRQRFACDNAKRRSLGKPERDIDPYFIAALEQGLPDCAGVALGVDRLVMALLGLDSIAKQRSF
ncbi:EF-P lysine aminoacylase EpmA [Agaribacterium haliotis]|uniref:EF-P lysine aminoacylase EpmA n=1 Tax=Agaribacterium haliotis TaxID=2013869 RepID=UPI000BB54435|nr:EF-P lysine aminoacylase EpmA [Agaribacterium haliotis]